MPEKVYECMFILDSNKYARNPSDISAQIPKMVEKLDGEVLASRLWNEQKLAYPIKGQRKGTYWLTYFRLDTEKLTQFNRACKLNDNILRNLTLKVDDRLVEPLVSHALGTTKDKDTTAEKTSDKPAADSKETAAAKDSAPSKDAPSKDAPSKGAPAEGTPDAAKQSVASPEAKVTEDKNAEGKAEGKAE